MMAFVQPLGKSNKLTFGAAVVERTDKESDYQRRISTVYTPLSLSENKLVVS